MILQALQAYYERLVADPERDVPLPGFSTAKIGFALVLATDGRLVDVIDLREAKGKKSIARQMEVPQAVKRTVGLAANFFWDNTGYVLGAAGKGNQARTLRAHQTFKGLCREVAGQVDDPGVKAVLAFLDAWRPTPEPELPGGLAWEEIRDQNLVFRLEGHKGFVHESPALRKAWLAHCQQGQDVVMGQCLVSGEMEPLARLHPAIKGVRGAQSTGGNLVSFNLDAFTSYGKTQSYNAPVGETAAFAYTTALNCLLADDAHRILIGDATTIFWSERSSLMEGAFKTMLEGQSKNAEDTSQTNELSMFLDAARKGLPHDAPEARVPFYVLGLSPNAGRLSVRFWLVSTVAEMAWRLGQHLEDISLVRQFENQPEFPPMWLMLRETAAQGKAENIPPQLAGEVTRALLEGSAYPRSLLAALIGRVRADGEMGYARAAFVKAYLCRLRRLNESYANDPDSMEVNVSLDIESKNPAYRLGRLFAVLEKLQGDAIKGANTTIRDRYMSAASSAPQATFPQLLRLAQAHIKKSDWGRNYDERIKEILNEVEAFPRTLSMEQQGLFFLGYYHQVVDLFTKKPKDAVSQNQNGQRDEEE